MFIILRYIKVLVDAAVHSEHGKVIKCDFKPGSVVRYIRSIPKRVYLSRQYVQLPPPIKIEKFSSGYKNPQSKVNYTVIVFQLKKSANRCTSLV
jgi:hypothetical protein